MSEADRVIDESSGLEREEKIVKGVNIFEIPEFENVDLIHQKIPEDEKIDFDTMLDIAERINSRDIDKEELEEFQKEIKIRLYLPMIEKLDAVISLSVFYDLTGMQTIASECELEMAKFWSVLLGKYTNFDIPDLGSLDYDEKCTMDNYDLCSAAFELIVKRMVGADYDKIDRMLNRSIIIDKINRISDSLKLIDSATLVQSVKSNEELVKTLLENKDLVASLGDIMKFERGE